MCFRIHNLYHDYDLGGLCHVCVMVCTRHDSEMVYLFCEYEMVYIAMTMRWNIKS